jgi:hypothetical protein
LTVNPRVRDTACAIIEQLETHIYPAVELLELRQDLEAFRITMPNSAETPANAIKPMTDAIDQVIAKQEQEPQTANQRERQGTHD